jgi:hypothetical protein
MALATPPASTASPTPSTASTQPSASLPVPRSHPLIPGSPKEISLINYLDNHILRITRRYAKKFSSEGSRDDTPGYTSYDEFFGDVDPLVDVVWISATPNVQIPYLLSLAGLACSYLEAFAFSASVFPLTSKLDRAFSTLLQGQVSMTNKVRIKSLIEETRIAAVNASGQTGVQGDSDSEEEEDDDDDDDDHQATSTSLALSRIYKKTLEILGDDLTSVTTSQDDNILMT